MTIALLVGRFQPFHFGHLDAVQNILKNYDSLIILIGSANKSGELRNPFNVKERMLMITNTLNYYGVDQNKYEFKPVDDFNDDELWLSRIKKIVVNFDIVFSNDPLTLRIFENHSTPIKKITLLNRNMYSSTEIRGRLIAHIKQTLNNEETSCPDWKIITPPPVIDLLNKINYKKIFNQIIVKYSESDIQNGLYPEFKYLES